MSEQTAPRHVLVTGATGFIAQHIVRQLLDAGHHVRGSVRNSAKADAFRATLSDLVAPEAMDRFETVRLDLESDEGWDAALEGMDVLMHTASPFPMVQPSDEMEAIRPAVEGTKRALLAAARAGVKRVVLTSSVVSIAVRDRAPGPMTFTEDDWSETTGKAATPYAKSKTLAERAAWELAKDHALDLTTINPALVLGAPLGGDYGTSVALIERVMAGKDPMMPRLGFSVVDVRDIAAMHVAAMERPAAIGKRFIGASEFFWFADVAQVLEDAMPDRKFRKPVAPDALIRLLSIFDKSLRGILPALGREDRFDTTQTQEVLGINFRGGREMIAETGQALVALGKG